MAGMDGWDGCAPKIYPFIPNTSAKSDLGFCLQSCLYLHLGPMPKWAAYLYLVLFLTLMVRPAVPYWSYSLHQDYIAKVLCVNREAPEMKCNGACHLRKMVKAAEPQEDAPAPVVMGMEEFPAFIPEWPQTQLLDNHTAKYTFSTQRMPHTPILWVEGKPPQPIA